MHDSYMYEAVELYTTRVIIIIICDTELVPNFVEENGYNYVTSHVCIACVIMQVYIVS